MISATNLSLDIRRTPQCFQQISKIPSSAREPDLEQMVDLELVIIGIARMTDMTAKASVASHGPTCRMVRGRQVPWTSRRVWETCWSG